MQPSEYGFRRDFVVSECVGKSILDLGVVADTCEPEHLRIQRFPSSLHCRIASVATSTVGVDYSTEAIEALQREYPDLTLLAGDVEALANVVDGYGPFDVVVMGDIIEHLNNPGQALTHIRNVLRPDGRLVLTCPNALGLPNMLRHVVGRFREGPDHVASHNQWTIQQLLVRHGFRPIRVATAYEREPRRSSMVKRIGFETAKRFLAANPRFGGTLVVCAEVNHLHPA